MRKVENKQKLLRRFVIAALAIASFVFMTACADSASDIADMKGGVTAQQIIENPSAYVGKNCNGERRCRGNSRTESV